MINYDKFLNRELSNVKPSGIRRFFDIASEIDDVISLSIGEPDFTTPWHIRETGIDTLEKVRPGTHQIAVLRTYAKKSAVGSLVNTM